jgi:hypothetical protein
MPIVVALRRNIRHQHSPDNTVQKIATQVSTTRSNVTPAECATVERPGAASSSVLGLNHLILQVSKEPAKARVSSSPSRMARVRAVANA